jgi:hypothetical protein
LSAAAVVSEAVVVAGWVVSTMGGRSAGTCTELAALFLRERDGSSDRRRGDGAERW